MICDVCGRNNADSLTFCQDCGRRLRAQRVVAPTPPNGMPKVEPPAATLEPAPESARSSSPSSPPSAGRRARPAAPVFSFHSVEPVAEAPRAAAIVTQPQPSIESAVGASDKPALRPPTPEAPAPANKPGPSPIACPECRTANPPEYRFCVTCGTSLRRPPPDAVPHLRAAPAVAAPVPGELAVRPHAHGASREASAHAAPPLPPRTPTARAEPKKAPASPAADGDPIIGAPVVDIASAGSIPAKIVTCPRCRGQSVGTTRFCKYCGAPLDGSGAPPRPARTEPMPDAAPSRDAAPPKPPPPARKDSVGRVPLQPIGKAQPPPPPRPVAHEIAAPPAHVALPHPSRPARDEPGVRSEVSQLAGSPIPAEPVHLPPRAVPGRWKGGRLVVIVEDGSEGRSFSLAEGQLDIGRTDGDIILEDDAYVSPRHARLRRIDGTWILRDLDSTNHVYLRLRKAHALKDGDLLLLGLEVLQFQTVSDGERGLGHAIQHGTFLFGSPATPRRARLCQRTVEGVIRDVYHVFRDETVIGREVGDIVFTADPFLSRRHAAIRRNAVTSEFSLVDLDSSNGTYVAIRGEVAIADGDFLRIGQHLFRVDLG